MRGDAVLLVPAPLFVTAPVGFLDRGAQRARHHVRVQDHPSVDVTRRPSNGLDQGGFRPQEAFLVRVQDRHQRAFRNVEPLPQQVDPDQHVEHAQSQVADDFDALQRVDVGVQIADPDTILGQVIGQILRHALGQGGDQHTAPAGGDGAAFREQIVHLVFHRTDFRHGVDQAGGADDLFGEGAAGAVHLPRARRRGDEHRHGPEAFPFLEFQWPVVDAGRQPETEFRQDALAREIALVHAAKLRHRDVAFVDDQQRVFRQILEQGRRRIARRAAGEIAGVILDPLANPGRLDHFDIERRALGQPFHFQQFTLGVQFLQPCFQLHLDIADRLRQRGPRRHVMAVGVDGDLVQRGGLLPGQGIELVDRLDLVAEQGNPPGPVLLMRGENVDHLAAQPERAALERDVVAPVLQFDQRAGQRVTVDLAAGLQLHHHPRIRLDRADAVNARHRGDDHHIVPLQQRLGRGVAHAVDLLVDLRVLLDIRVGARHIGFRLIVIVITDEIFHRVIREKAFHLPVQLRRQRLVRRQDQGGPLHRLDHLGHAEGLAGAGDAQQHLIAFLRRDAAQHGRDRRGLVAGGFVLRNDLEAFRQWLHRLFRRREQHRQRFRQNLGHGVVPQARPRSRRATSSGSLPSRRDKAQWGCNPPPAGAGRPRETSNTTVRRWIRQAPSRRVM